MEKLAITIHTSPGAEYLMCQLLLESLREFGGKHADASAVILTTHPLDEYSKREKETYAAIGAEMLPIELDDEIRNFPFAEMAYAAAHAEDHFIGRTEFMVWMLSDTLVVGSLDGLVLPDGANIAYRPVHHTLIGSPFEQPVDDFWRLLYQHCEVPGERVFPMRTCVGDNLIRPYFNAGMVVTRPQKGVFKAWRDTFENLYHHPDFQPFYERDPRYAVFMHQAVLSGVVLSSFTKDELVELPPTFNYPLHLHSAEMPLKFQPQYLNDLTTFRYENPQLLQEALGDIRVREPLKGWLAARLKTD